MHSCCKVPHRHNHQKLIRYFFSDTNATAPYFMAPEVFEEKYSFKADIWSVGCVMFQMITGKSPWMTLGFNNPVSLFNYLKVHEGPPPMKIPTSVDIASESALRRIMAKCFKKDPDDRPEAQDLLLDPFFLKTHSDDDLSTASQGLFSPETFSPWEHLRSPSDKMGRSSSPEPLRTRSAPGSPFLSPPLPKRATSSPSPATLRSPKPDTSEWPSWARRKNNVSDANSPAKARLSFGSDVLCDSESATATKDSLTYSTDSSGIPLFGIQFLSDS